jgi:membrane-bound lytic murein transglycosylase A
MELTPGRSLAVDREHIPLGVPLWLEVKEAPVPGGEIKRLVMAQDTGGAIKGPVRGDLFWGHGPDAETGAGLMKARGRYTMLAPRNASFVVASDTK